MCSLPLLVAPASTGSAGWQAVREAMAVIASPLSCAASDQPEAAEYTSIERFMLPAGREGGRGGTPGGQIRFDSRAGFESGGTRMGDLRCTLLNGLPPSHPPTCTYR